MEYDRRLKAWSQRNSSSILKSEVMKVLGKPVNLWAPVQNEPLSLLKSTHH